MRSSIYVRPFEDLFYQDEYDAYMLSDYYDRIILKGEGLSSKEIIKIIEDNYKTKTHIIKEFIQHCAPEK